MRVKVCGITNYEDAVAALSHGVDALGFNFFPGSPRYIAPDAARSVIRRLPPLVTTVGVFVDVEEPQMLERTAHSAGVQVLQLHGNESPEYCRRLGGWPLIKAVRIGHEPMVTDLAAYEVQALLLDTRDEVLFGGTGKTFDWNQALGIRHMRPIILAGGLSAENVAAAIRAVRPYGVDVCSGIESEAGKKDESKLIAFMNEVSNASIDFETERAHRAG
jgi:phosphoribosylanthranilate isomerase